MITGSRKKDAVFDSSAVPPLSQSIVELRAGSGRHFGDRLPWLRALWISALALSKIRFAVFSFLFFLESGILLLIFQVESLKYRQLTYSF